jgi:hypothetical protein
LVDVTLRNAAWRSPCAIRLAIPVPADMAPMWLEAARTRHRASAWRFMRVRQVVKMHLE